MGDLWTGKVFALSLIVVPIALAEPLGTSDLYRVDRAVLHGQAEQAWVADWQTQANSA